MSIDLVSTAWRSIFALGLLFFASTAFAADASDPVLIRRGSVAITKSDYEAELQRIPAQDRSVFASSPRRNRELIEQMLVTRELALRAKERKLDQDPVVRRRLELQDEKLLATVMVDAVEQAAAREFDTDRTRFERAAREQYMIDKASYTTPETVMVTQIFFSAEKDGMEGAKKRADEAYAKIRAGADMGDLAASISDDASSRNVRGHAGPYSRRDMEAQIADAVFALKKPGDVSEPIKARLGWYVVRLDERKPPYLKTFDEAKGEIMASLRTQHINEARAALARSIGEGKEVVVDEAAIEALRTQPH
jgi:peptidyl-prolyl cis-trans isomerase C